MGRINNGFKGTGERLELRKIQKTENPNARIEDINISEEQAIALGKRYIFGRVLPATAVILVVYGAGLAALIDSSFNSDKEVAPHLRPGVEQTLKPHASARP